jgi:serine/threonine-protein kinase RsbW
MGGSQAPEASPLPLWWSRQFRGQPSQVGHARSWIAGLFPRCEPLDDLLFFASELGANAVTHTRSGKPGGLFTVEVTWSPTAARVVVGDQGSDEVPRSTASPDDAAADLESGRGLLLIEAMSAAWGTAGDATARWLWADVHWRSRGGSLPAGPGDNSAARQFAVLSRMYPGTTAWHDSQSGQWHATLPAPDGTSGTLSAPSPAALAHQLAARYPRRTSAQYLMAATRARQAASSPRAARRHTS